MSLKGFDAFVISTGADPSLRLAQRVAYRGNTEVQLNAALSRTFTSRTPLGSGLVLI